MSDLTSLITQIRTSTTILTAPTSSPTAIKKAEQTLLQIKTTLPDPQLIPLSQTLLSPLFTPTPTPLDFSTSLFAFQLLRDNLLHSPTPWHTHPPPIRQSLRQIALNLFTHISATNPSTYTPLHPTPPQVRSSVVALLSALAIREWPQQWPDFLPSLLADPPRAETVARVLTDLSDEINSFSHPIHPQRLQELRRVMALSLPQTLPYITAAADAFLKHRSYPRLHVVLNTLESFLPWAALHSVFASNVPHACFQLLHDANARPHALPVLAQLAARTFADPGSRVDEAQPPAYSDRAFGDSVFAAVADFVQQSSLRVIPVCSLLPPSGVLPAFAEAYGIKQVLCNPQEMSIAVQGMHYDADEHEFCVAFFEMAATLGSKNFFSTYLYTKRKGRLVLNDNEQRCAERYVEIMLCAAASPSLTLRLKVLPFFTAVLGAIHKLRDVFLPLHGVSRFLVLGYLHAACLSVIRFGDDPVYDLLHQLDEGVDVEDDLPETFLPRTIASLANAAKLEPEFASMSVLSRLRQALERYGGQGAGLESHGSAKWIKELGYVVPDGSPHGWQFGPFAKGGRAIWMSCVSGTILAAEAVISGAAASEVRFDNRGMLQMMRVVFEMVAGISESDLLALKAQALRIFLPLYALQDPTFLRSCFQLLVAQGVNVNISSNARFKACLAVSAICRRLASKQMSFESLASFRENMCSYTVQAFSSRTFESANKLLLLEASIATILGGSDAAVQRSFVDRLFAPFLVQLQSSTVQSAFQSPEKLIAFVSEEQNNTAHVYEALQAIEAGAHQVVRPVSKSGSSDNVVCALSQPLAAQCVATVLPLIESLHGLYNPTKFPLDGTDGVRQSILHPTSKEVASFLNLDGQVGHYRQDHVHEVAEQSDKHGLGSSSEQKNIEILMKHGIKPPKAEHNHKRECLKSLRRFSYEIVRCAMYAGVIQSANEVDALLRAVTTDYEYMEPIHMVELTSKVLRPLLCFQLAALHGPHMERLTNSRLTGLFQVIRTHIEHVKPGELIEGDDALLSISRDHGRIGLAKAAIDTIISMFPKIQGKETAQEGAMTDRESYLPRMFTEHNALGNEIMSLWICVCNVWATNRSSKDSQAAFGAIATAADIAPQGSYSVFEALLKTSVDSAVRNSGLKDDSPLESAIAATTAILRKWPNEADATLRQLLGAGDAHAWVTECMAQMSACAEGKSKGKKQRACVRNLITKLAQLHGVSHERRATVKALPTKLRARNPARNQRHELEEVVLAEAALDSLYHDGDPL